MQYIPYQHGAAALQSIHLLGTVYTWVNPKKKKDKLVVKDDYLKLKIKLADFELENKILKGLLKKLTKSVK